MKIINVWLIASTLFLLSPSGVGQETKELQARKIKIITATDSSILTRNVTLGDSGLVYTVDETDVYIEYGNIDYIYIKEGGSYPKLLLYCTLFGLGYGVVWGLVSVTQTFLENIAIGLAAGVISSIILVPFITKPEKLIYYKGKWNYSKYSP